MHISKSTFGQSVYKAYSLGKIMNQIFRRKNDNRAVQLFWRVRLDFFHSIAGLQRAPVVLYYFLRIYRMYISLVYNVENSGFTNNPEFYYGCKTPARPVYLQDTHG
jgi:hypothetical protein